MTYMTFRDYLTLNEEAAAELAQLGMKRQQLVLKKAMADRQIDAQIASIDKLIFQKEKQKADEDKKAGVEAEKQQPQQQQQQQQRQGNQTSQPGSTGSQTPGSGQPQQQQF